MAQVYVSGLSLGLEVVNHYAKNSVGLPYLPQPLLTYLSLSDLPLHDFPFVLQVGEVLLCVALWTLGRQSEQLVTLFQQLLIQLLLHLEGRTQLLQDTMA